MSGASSKPGARPSAGEGAAPAASTDRVAGLLAGRQPTMAVRGKMPCMTSRLTDLPARLAAPMSRPRAGRLMCAAALATLLLGAARADDGDARQYVQFVEEFAGNCVARQGVQILVKNSHPTRTLRVWLDRWHMGVGTGDRSRSELLPGAEPEALGCSRSVNGPQEWRMVRAEFVD